MRRGIARTRTWAGLLAAAMGLTACGPSGVDTRSSTSTVAAARPVVGVILPDRASSTRWEEQDRPMLAQALQFAGVEPVIENAEGDENRFASLADSLISRGAKVLIIVPLSSEGGVTVERKAADAGIPVIDYDRISLGGSAEYYVSFDNLKVGELQAAGLVNCLGQQAGPKRIVEIQGSPTDNNATQLQAGQQRVLRDRYDSGAYQLVRREWIDNWDPQLGAMTFRDILSSERDIDGVIAANDQLAAGVLAVLRDRKLLGKVPVTGQDATLEGLRAVLRGEQCVTVYKSIRDEAEGAARLAVALATGDRVGADDLATGNTTDQVGRREVKSLLLSPEPVDRAGVVELVSENLVSGAVLCADDMASVCAQAGIG
ncbi:sugar ABC transporter substrate-binding protein [Goodfellowiella coeruleoviolacea]|uniref:D-xylose transport system substrate-binding protein n=1 Tax=Goodfellowiella coeruleoviolacea TaxID=334858 RepID=A0AAE3KFG2_9PSEU|nr:substrate-binding domain-containing protein [Goodfellowiella coeruleoviolacea]MCP2164947.1 D-xylose transport system substrate-binding protein [Goodfellowiella coeruleoviolacea]